ncbi:hypothetical protein KJ068_14210 [bacterium]|nr:hypothetical protein [bacterium]NUM76364.1 hypothetical protein [candidate division KSB1 bacterium]RIK73246.1 MAG: hypothetical protein DCC62_17825 [candidate division KSB1 bacterium]
MKKNGFRFLIDEKGDKTAVLIDLNKHRRLWEDFYDLMMIEARRNDPRMDWKTAKKQLLTKRKTRHA